MLDGLVAKTDVIVQEEKLIEQGDAIVVAVSGGPDSVALLHVLFLLSGRYGWKLVVAHVDHQFRGAESAAEAAFVARLAERFGLPCEIGSIDVPAYIEESALNAQAAAREKRYAFLHQTAAAYGAARIALAHHADDQAETVLMRLLRGTGPAGLAGMPERRREKKVELIRPFLRIYKSDLVDHLLAYQLSYCEDSSNRLRKYFRNQIRLDILPTLAQFNEHLPEALVRLADMMRGEDDFMKAETARVYAETVEAEAGACRLNRRDLVKLHLALQRRLIKLILNYLFPDGERFDFPAVERLRTAILQEQTPNLVLKVNEQLYVIREYDQILFRGSPPHKQAYAYSVAAQDGELELPEAHARLLVALTELEADSTALISGSAEEALFDLDKLCLPLTVRNRRDGDRIEPFGLNGSKKVKDMFIDAKLAPSRRETLPLLVDASGRVLWAAGLRRSRHALVQGDTVRVLHMKLLLNQR